MRRFSILYRDEYGQSWVIRFDADDKEHAIEQFFNAEPNSTIETIGEI